MAEIIKTSIPFGAKSAAVTFTAATGTDYFEPQNADSRVSILIKNDNTQSATITFKAGDGALSSLGDIDVTVAGGAQCFVPLTRLESARVKVLSGEDKGKIIVSTAVETGGTVGNVSFAVLSVE